MNFINIGGTMNYKVNNNKVERTIIVVLLFLIFGISYLLMNMNKKHNFELDTANKLTIALTDTAIKYQNSYNEIVTEKKTLQTSVENLQSENIALSDSKRELMNRVEKLKKDKNVINAALIESRVRITNLYDSLNLITTVDSNGIYFNGNSKYLNYNISVLNAVPRFGYKPKLRIDSLNLLNKQMIDFSWGEKDEGYPVSFSVSNSNPYFETYNIESYAIPELNKKDIDPTAWGKIKKWMGNNWQNGLYFGAGAALMYIVK